MTNNPYLSIRSEADHLNDTGTVHRTHRPASLVRLIRIDGKTYRASPVSRHVMVGYDELYSIKPAGIKLVSVLLV